MGKKNIIPRVYLVMMVIIIIGLVVCIISVNKKGSNSSKLKYEYDESKTICQRNYYYNGDDTYRISVCNNKVYINKNSGTDKQINIKEDVVYLYNFITTDGNAFYFLTEKGHVYNLLQDNIKNDKYNVTKLGLKDITNIGLFYTGVTKDDAFNAKIYAVDKNGKMNAIKE
ncbi:MAG TPA: hypothetical protein PLV83_01540 [Bacilli bacterium]|nr:hypothetical protein [Bacilli bacterium]